MQPSVESVKRGVDESLTVNVYRSDGLPFVWHMHPEWELTLIIDGQGQRYVGDSVGEFGRGDLVLLPGNLPHTWHAEAGGGVCASAVVFFDRGSIPDLPELRPIHRLMDRAGCGLSFGGRVVDEVADQLRGLAQLDGVARLNRFWQIMDRLARVRSVARLSSQPFERTVGPGDQRDIDRVCRWVVEHLQGEIRQSDAAKLIHRSPTTFARFFKRMMGQSFIHYVVQLRVGRACRLLMETDKSITQIAMDSGFTNISYFNRAFRKHRGTTPRDLRRAFSQADS